VTGGYRGLCFNEQDGDPLICTKLCRLAAGFETDCAPEKFCFDAFGETIGVCYPDPVCGNSMVEAGESCDDGNATAGDGCSDTCQVELDFYCANATVAVLGANMGDTSNGTSVFLSACNIGSDTKEVIYTYTPAASGMLMLTLESATDQGMSVRTTCADDMTELGCADDESGGTNETLSVAVTAGTPVFIIVDGYLFDTDAGPFTLTLAQN
jgi:cysteine-rich repeat protein